MLNKLSIDNYALIDKSEIEFPEGFTVITGETGAGKSIMLDALSLLTGGRADSKSLGEKGRKMVVEAVFTDPSPEILDVCKENEIEWDEKELILRREVSPSGKSRGFVNDTPVNLSILNKIGENLIDIHSQHSNSLLNKPARQLQIIDAYGKNLELLEEYKKSFKEYVKLRNEIKQRKEKISKSRENKEFITFRVEQLDKLKPKRGELETLERESEILGDADRIKSDLYEAYTQIGGGNGSALRMLQGASSSIEKIDFEILDPEGNENLAQRLNSIKIELRDISDTLEEYADKISSDPQRYEKIQARIESLYEAMKRFKVKDEEELVELHENLKKELASIEGDGTNIYELEARLKELAGVLKEKARILSEAREKASVSFSQTISERIRPLGLPNVKFEVLIEKGKMTSEGQDEIKFYCSFNKNHPLQPVADIASGGEISRVMLGIKSVMAENIKLPTIIFDEIDTGVSGEIAHKMGRMMKEMSQSLQVMAVTHLPQVAASGQNHLKVFKVDQEDRTRSHIMKLSPEEREKEIAGMLSGTSINEVALENARILLKSV